MKTPYEMRQCNNDMPHSAHTWVPTRAKKERQCLGIPDTRTTDHQPTEPEPFVPEQRLYTLDEAKAYFLAQACAAEGHQWALSAGADGRPTVVYCNRGCGTVPGTITFPA